MNTWRLEKTRQTHLHSDLHVGGEEALSVHDGARGFPRSTGRPQLQLPSGKQRARGTASAVIGCGSCSHMAGNSSSIGVRGSAALPPAGSAAHSASPRSMRRSTHPVGISAAWVSTASTSWTCHVSPKGGRL